MLGSIGETWFDIGVEFLAPLVFKEQRSKASVKEHQVCGCHIGSERGPSFVEVCAVIAIR